MTLILERRNNCAFGAQRVSVIARLLWASGSHAPSSVRFLDNFSAGTLTAMLEIPDNLMDQL